MQVLATILGPQNRTQGSCEICKNILTVYLLFTRAHHITVVIWTKTMIHRHSHQQPATAAHQISSEEVSAQCTEDNGSAGHPHHPPHPTSTYSSYQWSMGKLNQNPNANHYTTKYWCRYLTSHVSSTLCILCLYVWVLYCIEAAHSTHFKRWIHAAWGQSVLDFRILEHQHSNG